MKLNSPFEAADRQSNELEERLFYVAWSKRLCK